MNVKTDTKEKFTVIVPLDHEISAIMADEWKDYFTEYMKKEVPHLVLNLQNIASIEQEAGDMLFTVQQSF